jgi:hypothetical protein
VSWRVLGADPFRPAQISYHIPYHKKCGMAVDLADLPWTDRKSFMPLNIGDNGPSRTLSDFKAADSLSAMLPALRSFDEGGAAVSPRPAMEPAQ